MYVLQAILLILKLIPLGTSLFFYGGQVGKSFSSYFCHIDWWIILIPSYFIIARGIVCWVSQKIKE